MTHHNTIRIIAMALACLLSLSVNAQSSMTDSNRSEQEEYVPTTNWPYLNPTFEQGTIMLANGTYSNATMNIHLHDGILQCIGAGGRISRVTFTDIVSVTMADKKYINMEGQLMECLAANADSTVMLLLHTEPDFESLLRSSSTYHMNMGTVTSAKIQQLNLKGRNNEVHDEMRAVWYDGKRITLKRKFYFCNRGVMTHATRKNILKGCSSDKERKSLKDFIKKNKIKFDNRNDVITVFDRLYGN